MLLLLSLRLKPSLCLTSASLNYINFHPPPQIPLSLLASACHRSFPQSPSPSNPTPYWFCGLHFSLNALDAEKVGFLEALMWMASPVLGLRPMRSLRSDSLKVPNPNMEILRPLETWERGERAWEGKGRGAKRPSGRVVSYVQS